jgi:hypothetical protein
MERAHRCPAFAFVRAIIHNKLHQPRRAILTSTASRRRNTTHSSNHPSLIAGEIDVAAAARLRLHDDQERDR